MRGSHIGRVRDGLRFAGHQTRVGPIDWFDRDRGALPEWGESRASFLDLGCGGC